MKVIVTPGFVIYFTWESTWILSVLKNYQSFSNYVFQRKHSVVRNTHIYIIYICRPYYPNSKRCLLCLNEKYEIATYKGDNLLNKRTEIINTCRHRNKYKLANYDAID